MRNFSKIFDIEIILDVESAVCKNVTLDYIRNLWLLMLPFIIVKKINQEDFNGKYNAVFSYKINY